MIRRLVVGIARLTFSAALFVGIIAGALFYAAYRMLRWVTVGAKPTPARDAAFGLLLAIIVFTKAVGASRPTPGPWLVPTEEPAAAEPEEEYEPEFWLPPSERGKQ